MSCTDFRKRLESYLEDSLDEPSREAFRSHLRSCPDCRELAIRREPALVFAAIESPEPDPIQVAACTASVMSQIRQQRLARRLHPRRRTWLAVAAVVVIALAGVGGWWLSRSDQHPTPTAAVEANDTTSPEPLPPRVHVDMPGEGVRVYHFADEGNDGTAVYYIVNPALES